MQIIAIINEKGGTAKTTTTVNLAAALGRLGKKVLVVDLDGQAASSRWLGVEEDHRLAEAIVRGSGLEPIPDVAQNVDLAPASGKIDSVAHDLRPTQGGQLRKLLREMEGQYEYILLDCPPSLGNRLIGNALLAATHALAPVECSILALDGLRILLTMLEDIKAGFGHDIRMLGVLACRYEHSERLSRLVLAELQRALPGKVFSTVIRETVRIQEAPASGKCIMEYAPSCPASEDYMALAHEVIGEMVHTNAGKVSTEDDDLMDQGDLDPGDRHTVMDFRRTMLAVFEDDEAQPVPPPPAPVRAPSEHPVVRPAPSVPGLAASRPTPEPVPAEIPVWEGDAPVDSAQPATSGGVNHWILLGLAALMIVAMAVSAFVVAGPGTPPDTADAQPAVPAQVQPEPPVKPETVRPEPPADPTTAPVAQPASPQDVERTLRVLREMMAGKPRPDTGADPDAQPKDTPEQARPQDAYRLQCVMRSRDGDKAVINGEIVGVGQSIGDAEVVEVRQRAVTIKINGKLFVLEIGG